MRRTVIVTTLVAVMGLFVTAPAQAIIHEIVASHCNGQEGFHPSVDPPGQLRDGQSFARALQATGVYDPEFGVDQGGVDGVNFLTGEFGPLPSPGEGEASLTVFVDATKPSAKLGDFLFWAYFLEQTPGGPLHVYLEIYELDHPSFDHCPKFHHD